MKDNEIISTRYLYILDEVQYTLLETLIRGLDFYEVVFWSGEIFYSGFYEELWQFIFEFNYNFCAITHPKFEGKLYKLYKKYQSVNNLDGGFEQILSALIILFESKKNFIVFNKWIISPKHINKVCPGRTPKWFNKLNVDKKYYNFIRSIKTKNFINIMFYLKSKEFDYNELYETTKKYFKDVTGNNLNSKNLCLDNLPYKNKEHIILTLICYMFIDEKYIEKRSIFITCDHSLYKPLIIEDNAAIVPKYKTLPKKYKYLISTTIGYFPLARFNKRELTVQDIYWYHWEYFAYKSPLWKSRFDKYCINVNNEEKQIEFKYDLELEDFNEKYYYEPDEQLEEVQKCSIPQIPIITFDNWKKLMY